MGRNWILPGLLIIVILVVASCRNEVKCEGIQEQADRDDCFLERARNSQSIEPCNRIDGELVKESCLAEQWVLEGNGESCSSLRTAAREFCIAKIAIASGNLSQCNLINSTYWSDICNKGVSLSINDTPGCLKVAHEKEREDCFKNVAIATNDGYACTYIKNDSTHDVCITKIALSTENESVCEETRSVVIGDACIYKIAKAKNDVSLCDLISFFEIKKDCRNKVGAGTNKGVLDNSTGSL